MQSVNFEEVVSELAAKNPRFHRDAFIFVRQGIEFTQKKITKGGKAKARHISGPELLEGMKEFALEEFGPMAITVLEEWGIRKCEDFGEIVFIMVENGLLSKTQEDSKDDFTNGYTFEAAFREPFLPSAKKMAQGVENSPQAGV